MSTSAPDRGLSLRLLVTMAVASGVSVANLYYLQPLMADMGRTFRVSALGMGFAAMLAQVGFAVGVLLFVPIGDIRDRKRLILIMLGGATAGLIAVAVAPTYAWLAVACFTVGIFSVTPQMFVPFAAHLADPGGRGRAVGIVMSGLLIGILLSRTASGLIGAAAGWRAVFWLASLLTVLLAVVLTASLPVSVGTLRLSYPRLLRSLWQLLRSEPILVESAFAGAMFFGAFSAFWSMLPFRLETPPLHYGARTAGLFGLIGVVGAAAAPLAGRLADRLDQRTNVRVALFMTMAAFVVLAVFGHTLTGLVVGVILLDAGVQAGHVTNQSRIHALTPEARNRLTTIYMVAFFLGGAAGSALGASAWQHWQWAGVCGVGILMPLAGAIKLSSRERASFREAEFEI
jgi:predicted MFS family arabinose efflux permease